MSVEAKCPHCRTLNIWGDCYQCSSNNWKGHFNSLDFFMNSSDFSSVECKKCGNIEYAPIECVNCEKDINYQFFKDTSLKAKLLNYFKYAIFIFLGTGLFIVFFWRHI